MAAVGAKRAHLGLHEQVPNDFKHGRKGSVETATDLKEELLESVDGRAKQKEQGLLEQMVSEFVEPEGQ